MDRYIVLDGFKYAVVQGTYIRKWVRSFTLTINAISTNVNFTDKGPGVRTYDMQLMIATWPPESAPYKDGVTQTAAQQLTNLETSYGKISKVLAFQDIFGNPPSQNGGVFFTNYNQILPDYATPQKVYAIAQIELTEAKGEVVS